MTFSREREHGALVGNPGAREGVSEARREKERELRKSVLSNTWAANLEQDVRALWVRVALAPLPAGGRRIAAIDTAF